MRDRNVGIWVGAVFIVVGLVFALLITDKDAFALGGAGLIVIGALAVATSFDDVSGE